MYCSQQNEDKILHEKYLNYKNGFFIELGAMNGLTFSNTYFFEKTLDWTGILIEPTNQYHELISNRPNCFNFNYAISEEETELEFIGDQALGGLTKSMTDNHRKGWGLDERGSVYFVKSIPLSKLLSQVDVDKVDFFSIDVEGGEFEVLNTFDWSIPVHVILFELSDLEEKNIKCRNLLMSKGLNFDMIIGNNEVWVNKNFKLNK